MNKGKIKNLIVLSLISVFLFSGLYIKAQKPFQISEDVRKIVPEKDLIEVSCLMTKWKTGEFFAALDGLQEVLTPALQDIQSMGIDVSIPDIAGYRSQGQAKLNAICNAPNYAAAQEALKDFISFGETVRQELGSLNNSLGLKMKAKGDEMRARVESEINAWVEQERIKIEQELKNKADQLANQAKADLEQEMMTKEFTTEEEAMSYAQSRVEQIKATIESQINSLAEQKKKELEEKANAKASEILGGDAEKFKAIGERLQGIEQQINQAIEVKKQDYEKYRIQAMAKRKDLILAVLDENIEEACNQIREKEDLLKEAKLNDSSVKTADEYIAELNRDKEILVEKIQAAIDNGNESAINSAVEEIKNKWEGIRLGLERDLSKRQTAEQICSQVIPQLSQAKVQIENGLVQIETGQKEITEKKDECDVSQVPLCAEVEDIFNQLSTTKEKARNLINQINLAEERCSKVTEDTPLDNILELMLSLKENGSDFQKEMAFLKTEWLSKKAKLEEALAQKPKIEDICNQALPKISQGKNQINKGLEEIRNIQEGCKGNLNKECKIINENLNKFNLAQKKGNILLEKMDSVENKCKTKTTLKELVSLLKEIEADSAQLLSLIEELKALKRENIMEEGIYIEAENETSKYLYPHTAPWHSHIEIDRQTRRAAGCLGRGNWYISRIGESLSYSFEVGSDGDYIIWVRDLSSSDHPAGARAYAVIVDGKNYGTFKENNIRASYGPPSWGSFGWSKTATVPLGSGKHILTVEKRGSTSAACLFDAYFITNNPFAYPPHYNE